MADDNDECPGKGKDLVRLGDPVGERVCPFIRHKADCSIQTGFLRKARDGEPLSAGAVQLGNPQGDGVYEVLDEVAPVVALDHSGPAQVASDAYRDGWDGIFGKRQPVGEA
jgi:hypothetical protein